MHFKWNLSIRYSLRYNSQSLFELGLYDLAVRIVYFHLIRHSTFYLLEVFFFLFLAFLWQGVSWTEYDTVEEIRRKRLPVLICVRFLSDCLFFCVFIFFHSNTSSVSSYTLAPVFPFHWPDYTVPFIDRNKKSSEPWNLTHTVFSMNI